MLKFKQWKSKNLTVAFAITIGLTQIVPDLFIYELTKYEIKYILISASMYMLFSTIRSNIFFNFLMKQNLIPDKWTSPINEYYAITLTMISFMCLSFIFKLELSRLFIIVIYSIFVLFGFIEKLILWTSKD
jgi:hypothetical protein